MSTESSVVRVDELRAEVSPVVAGAGALAIVTPDDYSAAGEFAKEIARALKRVGEVCDPAVRAADEAHKQAVALRASFADPLKAAKATVSGKQLAWQQVQERIRAAAQAKLQAEADERARKERERQEAAARLARQKEEAARAAEAEALRQAALIENQKEREAMQREAEKRRAEAEAAAAKAAAKEEAAAEVVAPVVQIASVTPKVQGQAIRRTWRARVVNVALVPREYLVPNQQALDAFARATKGAIPLPGIEMVSEVNMSTGGR